MAHWWFAGRRKIIFDQLRRFVSGGNVLVEVGCGTGYTIGQVPGFRKKIGIEKSTEALRYFRSREAVSMIQGEIPELPLKEKSADVVMALDVLEHIDDDFAASRSLGKICKKGGFLLVTVPAFQFLWSGEDVISMHKRRYKIKGLKEVLLAGGFKIKKISYFNFFLMPPMLAFILWSRIFKRENLKKTNMFELPGFINSILTKLFSSESAILKWTSLPFGSSIIALCEKEV